MANTNQWEDAPDDGWEDAPTSVQPQLQQQPYQRQPIEFSADPEASAFGQWAFQNPREATRIVTAATSLGGPFTYATGQAIQKAGKEGTWGEAATEAAKDIGLGYVYNALGKVVTAPVNYLIGKGYSKIAGTSAEKLKEASTAARKEMYGTGQTFDVQPLQASAREAVENVTPRYPSGGLNVPESQKAFDYIDTMIADAQRGKPIKIDELEHLNTQLNEAVKAGGRDRMYALAMKDKLNSFVEQIGGKTGELWKKARELETKQFRSQDIKNMVEQAVKSDSPTSKEIRKKFTNILTNADQMKLYTPEQRKIIKEIAEGTLTEKSLETIGRMTPKNIGWQSLVSLMGIGTGAGAAFGGGAAGIIPGAAVTAAGIGLGQTAKSTANALTLMRVNKLDELIRAGKLPYQIPDKYGAATVNYLLNPQLQGQQ